MPPSAATPQRILYIIDSLSVGGAEVLLVGLVDEARARGHAVHVAYFTPGPLLDDLAQRGVEVTRLGERGLRGPGAFVRAYRLMRRFRPTVVHTHLSKSDLVGQPAAWAAGVPLRLLTLHNINPWRKRRVLSLLYRTAVSGAHVCVAVSEAVGTTTVAQGGVRADRLQVVENGVDLGHFDKAAAPPLDLASLGVPEHGLRIAAIGRLTRQKDHLTFVRAAAALAGELPEARFLVVGEGELRADIRAAADGLGLSEQQLILTGLVRDVRGLMAATDVVVFSSAWEGLPMVLIEAMAMGLPVAATSVGAIPQVIVDGESGFLVPPGNPDALAQAIARLCGDTGLRAAMGAAARRRAEAGFSRQAMADRLFRIYEAGARPA